MITDRRPRIEDFEGLLGEFVAVYPDNNKEPVSWKLDQLVKLTTPPLPQMQGGFSSWQRLQCLSKVKMGCKL